MKTLFLDASASYGAVGLMLDGKVIFNKNTTTILYATPYTNEITTNPG